MKRHRIITTQDFERRIKSQMKQEKIHNELKHEILQRENTKAFCESDKRVHSLRRFNKSSLIANQQKDIDEFNALKERELNRQKEELRQAAIANAMQKKHQQIAREESLKKRVCAGSDELKDLKKLLNAAYLNLDLEKQISSKKLNQINAENDCG